MEEVVTYVLFVLVFDGVLGLGLWAYLLLLDAPSSCGGVACLWLYAVAKWACLLVFTWALTDGKLSAVLLRLLALLSLLFPVLESGRILTASPSDPQLGPSPDLTRLLLLSPACAGLVCGVWELFLCGERGKKTEEKKEDTSRLLARTLTYFHPDAGHLTAAFTFLILGVTCDSYIPLFQGQVVDMLRDGLSLFSSSSSLWWLALVSLGSALFSGLRGGIFMCSLARLNKRLKLLLFQRLLQQEVHFFEENNAGRLSARLHSDVDRMGRTVALNANAAVRSAVKTLMMLRLMLGLSWELTLLTCLEMPLLAIIQNKYSSLSRELKDQMQDCHAHNKDSASQTFGSIQTVRSFHAEEEELRRYREALRRMENIRRRAGIYSAVFCLIRRIVTLTIRTVMLVEARSLVLSGNLTVGSLVTFLLYQKPMTVNLKEILYCYGETVSTVGVISKVFSYLDRTPRWETEGDLEPEEMEGGIVLRNVSFSYPLAPDKPALKSVSVSLQPGKTTALVGPSGSGKSSLVSLLKRLYDPQEGQILLDGEPLHRYRLKYLHKKLALVSQNPVLFSGTLKYNILYGLEDRGLKTVEETAKKVDAHKFISQLEKNYDTDVGEGGGRLSEGERQCVAVLRALVRDPQVVILDEATSKLDVEAQHAVLREVLGRGCTVLIVAHQLQTVENADHIVFLEEGEVVEEGTHQQLMARRGRYYRMKEELFN